MIYSEQVAAVNLNKRDMHEINLQTNHKERQFALIGTDLPLALICYDLRWVLPALR